MSTLNENIGQSTQGSQGSSGVLGSHCDTSGGESSTSHAESGSKQGIRERARDTARQYSQRARHMASSARDQMYRDQDHSEGRVAWMIENQTARLPSDIFLWAAGGCIAVSLMLKMRCRDTDALFVGQWAPTFLILGLYNKIVKTHGHDENDYAPADMSSYGSYEAPYGAASYSGGGGGGGGNEYGGGEYGGGDYGYEDLR